MSAAVEPPSESVPAARWRVTLRGDTYEIRGYVDTMAALRALADAVKPLGVVVLASPADADYYPWTDGE